MQAARGRHPGCRNTNKLQWKGDLVVFLFVFLTERKSKVRNGESKTKTGAGNKGPGMITITGPF